MSRLRNVLVGLLGAVGLCAFIVVIPIGLVVLVGWPLPQSVPSFEVVSDWLTTKMSTNDINNILAVVCWVAWAQFVWCALVEGVAIASRSASRHVRFAGGTQVLARQLVLASAMLLATFHRSDPTPQMNAAMTHVVAVTEETPIASPSADLAGPTAETKACVVKPRDDLWSLAERHLGDPMRWREIYELNRGLAQPDGQVLERPDLIRPGWTLQMPTDAVSLNETAAIPGTAVSESVELPDRSEPPVQPETSSPVNESNNVDNKTTSFEVGKGADVASTDQSSVAPASPPHESSAPTVESDGSTPDVSTDEQSSSTLPQSILGAGLTAAGIVGVLSQLRRVQRRRRKVGERIPTPKPELAPIDDALHVAGQSAPASRLDLASRVLAAQLMTTGQPVPKLQAMRVGDDGIEFLFESALPTAAGTFEVSADGRCWTLPSEVDESRLGPHGLAMPSPFPTAVSVGRSEDDTVLIDLEASLWTAIDGDVSIAASLLHNIVMELATSEWADFIEVVVVGGEPKALDQLARIQHLADFDEAANRLSQMARATRQELIDIPAESTFAARLHSSSSDGWIPTVVVLLDSVDENHIRDLMDAVSHKAGQGLVVLSIGASDEADRVITVSGQSVIVDPPGLSLTLSCMSSKDGGAIDELIDQAAAPSEVPRPPVESFDDSSSTIDLSDLSTTGGIEIQSASSISTRQQSSPAEVVVNVLGPVQVVGGDSIVDRPKSVEVITYLALHPQGVSPDRLRSAIWPDKRVSSGSFHQTITLARTKLGTASNGMPFVPHVKDSLYQVSSAVTTDAKIFAEKVNQAAGEPRSEAINSLVSAAELIRGMPFAETRGYQWTYNEGIVGDIEGMVGDTVHQLAEYCLKERDAEKAIWAARQGLLLTPGWEVLYRDLMLAYEIQGNVRSIEAVMSELCSLIDADEPYDNLDLETVELFKRLSFREDARKVFG